MNRPTFFDLAVLLTALAFYLLLAVRMTASWKLLGDEPHYIVAAHSLVRDGDMDLANNYAQKDYQSFVEGETLDPHVKLLTGGGQILNHDLGLPVLIAMPYALAGRLGVELFLGMCGALLAWQMYKLAFALSNHRIGSVLAAFALAFTPPLLLYATLVYPEGVGALLFVWATRVILLRPAGRQSLVRLAGVATVLVILPWLSVRFLVLVTLLVVFIAVQWSAERRRVTAFFAVSAVSMTVYLFINQVLLSGTVPPGSPTELAGGNLATLSIASLTRSFTGWWLDPQRGTLILAPVYVLALAGIPRLLRANVRVGILLVAPLVVLIPLVALLGGFWIPFEVGARYFVVALALLSAPLALAMRDGLNPRTRTLWQRGAFAVAAFVLLGLSLWHGVLMVTDPATAYGSVVTTYSRGVGADLSPYFASPGRGLVVSPANTASAQGSTVAEVGTYDGQSVWQTAAGEAGTIVRSFDLTELTAGHYALRFRATARGASPDAEVLVLDVYSAEGLPLVHTVWRGGDLPAETFAPLAVEFDNPYYDRWSFPLTLEVTTTGAASLTMSALYFDPDNATTWLRIAVWVAGIFALVLLMNLDLVAASTRRRTFDAGARD
jgi:hypothetical protein